MNIGIILRLNLSLSCLYKVYDSVTNIIIWQFDVGYRKLLDIKETHLYK